MTDEPIKVPITHKDTPIEPDIDVTKFKALMSTKEVGLLLAVTPQTVRNWIADGHLAAIRVGLGPNPRIRVTAESVQEFLKQAYGNAVEPRK